MVKITYKVGDWVQRIDTNDYYVISFACLREHYYHINCVIMDGKPFKSHYRRTIGPKEVKAFYKLAPIAKVLYDNQ